MTNTLPTTKLQTLEHESGTCSYLHRNVGEWKREFEDYLETKPDSSITKASGDFVKPIWGWENLYSRDSSHVGVRDFTIPSTPVHPPLEVRRRNVCTSDIEYEAVYHGSPKESIRNAHQIGERFREERNWFTYITKWLNNWTSLEAPLVKSGWSKNASKELIGVLEDLRVTGHDNVADRLNSLIDMVAKDPDVGCLEIASAKSLSRFFIENSNIPFPAIVADSDGTLGVEWRLPLTSSSGVKNCDGILCMDFHSSGAIEYFGDAIGTKDDAPLDLDGEATPGTILEKIQPFLRRLDK